MHVNNSKNNLFLIGFVFVFTIIAVGSTILTCKHLFSPSICFVRSEYLINNFLGTKVARTKFENSKQASQRKLDTLNINFQSSINSYNTNLPNLSRQMKESWEKQISIQQRQLEEYAKAIELKVAEEDNKLMQAVLNQINGLVSDYAMAHGYDFVLGTSEQGTVLFGSKSLDVTENLLTELNNKYNGN